MGLSPRGRGNRDQAMVFVESLWSIPAWAGKPPFRRSVATTPWSVATTPWVYPRVGGETEDSHRFRTAAEGLSPRGRGNLVAPHQSAARSRSIPAWAGKPAVVDPDSGERRVYPRVGGETGCLWRCARSGRGLSPRGRGNRGDGGDAAADRGSIPAWAGKPSSSVSPATVPPVYPRVGGETLSDQEDALNNAGLSPRGRGNRHEPLRTRACAGSIPAWAGKPAAPTSRPFQERVYPRVGGETSSNLRAGEIIAGLSPRGRGNRRCSESGQGAGGSIPAWAGKPRRWCRRSPPTAVYPRVGGETSTCAASLARSRGLSPRGRGNHHHHTIIVDHKRSIPAWAGKPGQPAPFGA